MNDDKPLSQGDHYALFEEYHRKMRLEQEEDSRRFARELDMRMAIIALGGLIVGAGLAAAGAVFAKFVLMP